MRCGVEKVRIRCYGFCGIYPEKAENAGNAGREIPAAGGVAAGLEVIGWLAPKFKLKS